MRLGKVSLAVLIVALFVAACTQTPAAPSPTTPPAKPAPVSTQAPAAPQPTQQPAAAAEYPTMKFKAAHPFAPTHMVGMGFDLFAKNVSEMSGGKITIDVVASGALVTSKNELESIAKGVVDFGSVTFVYHAGELPFLDEAAFFPFLYNWKSLPALYDKVKPQLEEALAGQKIKLLGQFPARGVLYFRKPIDPKTPDLKGLRMRSAGGGEVPIFRYLGASIVTMSSPDVPVALRSGGLDGLGTSLPSWDSLGITEDVPYVYYTNDITSFTMDFGMNKERYAQLPPAVQQLIDKAAQAASRKMYDDMPKIEGDILKKAQSNPKVKMHEFSAEEVQAWRTKIQPVVDDFVKRYGDKAAQFVKVVEQVKAETAR